MSKTQQQIQQEQYSASKQLLTFNKQLYSHFSNVEVTEVNVDNFANQYLKTMVKSEDETAQEFAERKEAFGKQIKKVDTIKLILDTIKDNIKDKEMLKYMLKEIGNNYMIEDYYATTEESKAITDNNNKLMRHLSYKTSEYNIDVRDIELFLNSFTDTIKLITNDLLKHFDFEKNAIQTMAYEKLFGKVRITMADWQNLKLEINKEKEEAQAKEKAEAETKTETTTETENK